MLEKVLSYIDVKFPIHLKKTQEFLRIPNDSFSKSGLQENARWLKDYLLSLDGNVLFEGDETAPIIISTFDARNPKNLLVYGMYDVQPVLGQDWISPPFAANIVELPEIGPAVVARGACNSKGPLVSFINVIEAFNTVSKIPVNLILTIDGEEETGSPSLQKYYTDNKKWLRSKANACFEPFWAEYGTDVMEPIMSLGSKGILSIELVCKGGNWGGPTKFSVHSSVGAWISSPAWRLFKAVNTLMDKEENILIKNFTNDVVSPTVEDEELLLELSKSFNKKQTLNLIGAKVFKYQEKLNSNLLRKYLFSPSIQLGSIHIGEGDVITPEARIKLNIRLVPNMDPEKTIDKIKLHLKSEGFGDLEIIPIAHFPSSRTSLKEEIVQVLIQTYSDFGIKPQIWPMLASATPYYLFSEVLKLPYSWGGLGKAGRSHVANEYATIEGLKLFEKSIATFLYKFANQ